MTVFDDFYIGQSFTHWPGKTILESDNNLFSLLTCNHHPIHSDFVYASQSVHKKPLVVGTYVFSLTVGLTVNDLSLNAIANLEYFDIKHHQPTFIGDTLYAHSKVLDKAITSSKSRGIITITTEARNQADLVVLSFGRKIMFGLV